MFLIWCLFSLFFLDFFFISSGLEFWSVNRNSIYKISESKNFKDVKFLVEISNNQQNDLLGTNVYKTLESSW